MSNENAHTTTAGQSATWHAGWPWDRARLWFRRLRRAMWRGERPGGAYLRVAPAHVAEVEPGLGARGYAPNYEVSAYLGEDLNLAYVRYDADYAHTIGLPPTDENPGRVWWQNHVRGYLHSDGSMWLYAHYELEATENDAEHIRGKGMSRVEGMKRLRSALDGAGVPYEARTYPADAADADKPA